MNERVRQKKRERMNMLIVKNNLFVEEKLS
jgi:hypothetical protein